MSAPTCFRCGSRYVHRARMRSWWLRLLREYTPLRRYACGDCYHRGWTLSPFHRPALDQAGPGEEANRGHRSPFPAPALLVATLWAATVGLVGALVP